MARSSYQARYRTRYPEKDRDTFMELEVYLAGAVSAPSSGTISVWDGSNSKLIDGAAVTVTNSIANYTLLASALTAASYSAGWRFEWSLVMDDGSTRVFREVGSLVRVEPIAPVSDPDLEAHLPDLSRYLAQGDTSWQKYVLEAVDFIFDRLESEGRRPYLIVGWRGIRAVVLFQVLANVCLFLAGTGEEDNAWWRRYEVYTGKLEAAWASMTLVYDADDDGDPPTDSRVSGSPSVWLA